MTNEERTTFDESSESIAREFHITYERYAPQHGWDTQKRSRVMWDDLPDENKSLMIAVVKKLLIDGVIEPGNKTETVGN
jgi:hypothetical protein